MKRKYFSAVAQGRGYIICARSKAEMKKKGMNMRLNWVAFSSEEDAKGYINREAGYDQLEIKYFKI